MIERQGIGYAPAAREALKSRLLKEGFRPLCWSAAGWSSSVTRARSSTGSGPG